MDSEGNALEKEVAFAGFILDGARGQLRTAQGAHVVLRPRSLAVLCLLARNIGELITKDEILSKVWADVVVTEDSLTQCVADIRRALGDRAHSIVRTVPRRGYILSSETLSPHQISPAKRPDHSQQTAAVGTPPPAGLPKTYYAKSGSYYIAYQVTGDGPCDLVFVQGYVTHLEMEWENPWPARFYNSLGSFCRLVRFDKRGTGLSDRVGSLPTLEERMDDVRAVMDAVGSRRAVLLGSSEGGPMSVLFCASYPERVSSLVLYGAMARPAYAPDNSWGRSDSELHAYLSRLDSTWGLGSSVDWFAPSVAHIPEYRAWRGRLDRAGATPGAVATLVKMNHGIDVRHLLPSIRVPTLVLHRKDDRVVNVEHSRYIASQIPHAKYVELSGIDHAPWVGDSDAILREIRKLTGSTEEAAHDSAIATILAALPPTDATAAGAAEQVFLDSFARPLIDGFAGRKIDEDGYGLIAVFDGPGRAVKCAQALIDATKTRDIATRVGLHTGDVETWRDRPEATALRIAARVAEHASPGEVLLTGAVAKLVTGFGFSLKPRGIHVLEGIPGSWPLLCAS